MLRLITAGAGLALIATPLAAGTATATDTAMDQAVSERAAAAAFSVTAKINKATAIAKEDTVKVRGTVRPGAAGQTVVLQQRMEDKKRWKNTGTAKVKATGRFLLEDEPSAIGTRFYRVVKPAAGGQAKGVSKELELVVYGWQKLGQRATGLTADMSFGTAVIGTESFSSSLISSTPGTPATVEYTLGKKCLKLRSSYALTDSTETGGTGSAALAVDGEVAFTTPLALGQVVDHEVNITDAFRISYALTPSATPQAFVAAATPEVLCTL